MKVRNPNQIFTITQTVTDGEETLFIRAKIFNASLVDVTPNSWVALSHIFGGMYGNTEITSMPVGNYVVKFSFYNDSQYTLPSFKYGSVEEDYWVTNFEDAILTKIPDNILLDDDVRLDELLKIEDLANETTLTSVGADVIEQIKNSVDDSDGSAI